MLIHETLRACSGTDPEPSRLHEALRTAASRELSWALDAGLGPLLFRLMRPRIDEVPPPVRSTLLSADLTARVWHGARSETARELIDVAAGLGVPVTLLKGISIGEECYPEPHLRSMTDVDVLVASSCAADVEHGLLRRGYGRAPGAGIMGADPYHREPLYDPRRGTKVEIHTALFPRHSPLTKGTLFDPDHLADRSVAAEFDGRPARRLGPEVQLAYTASSWARDLSAQPIHPSFVAPLMDAVLLLRTHRATFDWRRLLAMLDNELAAASLDAMLSWLAYHGLAAIPSQVLMEIRRRQSLTGPTGRRLVRALVDRHLVGGRPFRPFNSWHLWSTVFQADPAGTRWLLLPWRIAFPPSYPDRYAVRAQARRVARLLRRC